MFSPYWNVPDGIAERETAPAAARDSGFLHRQNIEIYLALSTALTLSCEFRSTRLL